MSDDWRDRDDWLPPGARSDLDSCDREAIHLLPAAQPDGAILVVEAGAIAAAATNTQRIHGRPHGALLGQDVGDIIGMSIETLLESSVAVEITLESTELGERHLAREARAHRSRTGKVVVDVSLVDSSSATDDAAALVTVLDALRSASDLPALLQAASDAVREVLGFDRIWVYRFDDDANGEIVAESLPPDAAARGIEPFLGLRFGEGDIPAQARALYRENRVRVIRSTSEESAPIEPLPLPGGDWVDLSHAANRAVSPIHLTYLRNMGVTASTSLALVIDGELWGLVSGHHRSGPRLLGAQAARTAAIVADVVALQIAAIERADLAVENIVLDRHLAVVLAAVAGADSVLEGIVAEEDALLALSASSGCAVRMAQRWRSVGVLPPDDVVEAVFETLTALDVDDDLVVHECGADVVAELAEHADVAAGFVALSMAREPGNWIVWFRPERLTTVTYGDRQDLHVSHDELSPRNSFAKYAAEVTGTCEPWSPGELAAIGGLRSALGTIVFQRSEQLARSIAGLRAANDELDRFAYVAAHDLKEPLRGIYNYLEIIDEDHGPNLDADAVEILDSVQRLSLRMSDLVESLLTYATVGRQEFRPEPIALGDLVADAEDFVYARIRDTGARVSVTEPTVVITGDRLQLVQALTNLISNALKYARPDVVPEVVIDVVSLGETDRGWDVWPHYNIDIPPPTLIAVRDNGIGVPDERRDDIFEVFRRLHGRDEFGGGSGAGLTIARRIAERHGGMLWVEDNDPVGSVFYLAISAILGAPDD